jgi:hypothetical protein
MLMSKLIVLLAFLVSGGGFSHPTVKRYLQRHAWLQYGAGIVAVLSGIYLFVGLFTDIDAAFKWGYQRVTIGPFIDRTYSIAECDRRLTENCIRYAGSFGETGALQRIRACSRLKLLSSSSASLNWTSLWITSVFSYAPGGGGPGGGLIDEVLKVGGWGDWYHSLIKFQLPIKKEMTFAGVLLFVQDDEQETIPLYVDRIIEQWRWDLSQHIWWKDRPGGFPIVSEPLPPPEKTHWYVVEITRLYNQWVKGTAGNFGFQIRPASNYGSVVRFTNTLTNDKTKIPHLIICERTEGA